MVRCIFLTVVFLSILPVSAGAQDRVRVRSGDHDGYSRLVFDWGKRVSYEIKRDRQEELVVTFSNDADVEGGMPGNDNALSFQNPAIISKAPLTISLSVPADSRVRDFFAGTRLVVDVYDSPTNKKPKVNVVKQPPKKEMAPEREPVSPEETSPKVEPVPEKETKISSDIDHSKPVIEEEEKNSSHEAHAISEHDKAKALPEESPELLDVPDIVVPEALSGVVNLPATQVFGVGVFILNGKIWIVNDNKEVVTVPQVSGDYKDALMPVQKEDFSEGHIYKLSAPKDEDVSIRAQGGGVLWRLIISSEMKDKEEDVLKPLEPLKKTDAQGEAFLVWPIKEARKIMQVEDLVSGQPITVVTVERANQNLPIRYDFVDFEILPSVAGLAVYPKRDDLLVELVPEGVMIKRPGGLYFASDETIRRSLLQRTIHEEAREQAMAGPRIFDFKVWKISDEAAVRENKIVMLSSLDKIPEEQKIPNLMTLAQMHLAHGYILESSGFLDLAEEELPDLSKNPKFLALRGAVEAFTGNYEGSFEVFSDSLLAQYKEIAFWKAYVLAEAGDWTQAGEFLPADLSILKTYTSPILNRMGPVLAEVALRAGKVDSATIVLKILDQKQETLNTQQQAAIVYLKGEALRQSGKTDDAVKVWSELLEGSDDLYRAKAGLALVRLLSELNRLPPKEHIDRLERLRYAWRGDELEVQILYRLGDTYFKQGEYTKGLNILREAASLSSVPEDSGKITRQMSEMMTSLFLEGDRLDSVSPLDAMALYEQFSELVPTGAQGNAVVEKLADRLMVADLPGRASKLLSHQLEHRLSGYDAYRTALKLVRISLVDKKAKEAFVYLEKAKEKYAVLPEEKKTEEELLTMVLLESKILALDGRPERGIALLDQQDPVPDVNILRADIAWVAGYWDDAADALNEVITDRNINANISLQAEDAKLILNRAVALNLASDRIGLANMREKYGEMMGQTDQGQTFELVTRPHQNSTLADREKLLNIVSETDLFADFLEPPKEQSIQKDE